MKKNKDIQLASILGVIGNIILLLTKGIVGLLSHSQAMIADSLNSLGDVVSSAMTFVGNKISSKAADEDHNLGHGKAEYIYSFLISIIMMGTAIIIMKESIETYVRHETIHFSYLLVIVCLFTIIVKFSLFCYTNYLYKQYRNILIKANSKDHRNDCLITSMTLFSSILGIYGYYLIDIIVGLIISLWILWTALKLFKESYDILMDKSMNLTTKDKVYKLIERHKEVMKVNHFNATPVGYQYQISFTIFVDGNLSTFKSHEIANTLEREIEKEIPEIYLSVIHVNPVDIKKESNG